MTLAREPKQSFFLLSGRSHLGGDIWKEASGKLSEALWELWELGRPWGLQGHIKQKMLQIHCVLHPKYKNENGTLWECTAFWYISI